MYALHTPSIIHSTKKNKFLWNKFTTIFPSSNFHEKSFSIEIYWILLFVCKNDLKLPYSKFEFQTSYCIWKIKRKKVFGDILKIFPKSWYISNLNHATRERRKIVNSDMIHLIFQYLIYPKYANILIFFIGVFGNHRNERYLIMLLVILLCVLNIPVNFSISKSPHFKYYYLLKIYV